MRDSHMAPFFHPQQKPHPLGRHLFIAAALQKHPQHHGPVHSDHKDLDQEHQEKRSQKHDHNGAAVGSGQGADAHRQGQKIRSGGQLIDNRSKYATAPPKGSAWIDQRILHIPLFRFPDLLFLIRKVVLRDLHGIIQERIDDGVGKCNACL